MFKFLPQDLQDECTQMHQELLKEILNQDIVEHVARKEFEERMWRNRLSIELQGRHFMPHNISRRILYHTLRDVHPSDFPQQFSARSGQRAELAQGIRELHAICSGLYTVILNGGINVLNEKHVFMVFLNNKLFG